MRGAGRVGSRESVEGGHERIGSLGVGCDTCRVIWSRSSRSGVGSMALVE